jgi:signal transduction histidine kinase
MGGVVQNFLDLSRRPKGEPQPFALKPVLLRALEILRVELERSKVSVDLEWKAPDGITVDGDQHALHHVFLNLALNARYIMPVGGGVEHLGWASRSAGRPSNDVGTATHRFLRLQSPGGE